MTPPQLPLLYQIWDPLLGKKVPENIQGSVPYLYISDICVQGLLRCLELVYLSCMCASQVACHPVFIIPGIGEAEM